MVSDPGAQAVQSIGAQGEPKLQRPKPPPKGTVHSLKIHDFLAPGGFQIYGPQSQRFHLWRRIAQELHRTVKLDAEPLVRVEHDRIRFLDSGPKGAELGQIIAEPDHAAST